MGRKKATAKADTPVSPNFLKDVAKEVGVKKQGRRQFVLDVAVAFMERQGGPDGMAKIIDEMIHSRDTSAMVKAKLLQSMMVSMQHIEKREGSPKGAMDLATLDDLKREMHGVLAELEARNGAIQAGSGATTEKSSGAAAAAEGSAAPIGSGNDPKSGPRDGQAEDRGAVPV